MKKSFKVALLLALGLSAVATVRAQTTYNGDLIVGFTKTSGNDAIYDLGAESALVNGKTWNLSSLLSGYTISTLNWGVIGSTQPPITRTGTYYAWSTTAVGAPTPPTITGFSAEKSDAEGPIADIYQNFPTAVANQSLTISSSDENSWDTQTINPTETTDYVNNYQNPNVIGAVSANFYQIVDTGATPTLLGSFSLSSGGILTYNVAVSTPPVPQIINIMRAGSTSTIFFTTTNGSFTYTLYYTNSAGLSTVFTNWPASATTVTGNGLTNSLSDTTTSSNRFYVIGVH